MHLVCEKEILFLLELEGCRLYPGPPYILNAGFYHAPCWVAENVSQNTNVCPQLPIPCHEKLVINTV